MEVRVKQLCIFCCIVFISSAATSAIVVATTDSDHRHILLAYIGPLLAWNFIIITAILAGVASRCNSRADSDIMTQRDGNMEFEMDTIERVATLGQRTV